MSNNPKKKPMTKEAASRIQSSQAKNNQDTGKGSFASRAQSTGDKHTNAQSGQQQGGQQSGYNQGYDGNQQQGGRQ
jgi:hypothetical protein